MFVIPNRHQPVPCWTILPAGGRLGIVQMDELGGAGGRGATIP